MTDDDLHDDEPTDKPELRLLFGGRTNDKQTDNKRSGVKRLASDQLDDDQLAHDRLDDDRLDDQLDDDQLDDDQLDDDQTDDKQYKYDASEIQVLEGLEAVRRRPCMYIGDVDTLDGVHHMLWEVVANAIDEHLCGHATELKVELGPDGWISVRDDGRGIPTCPMPCGDCRRRRAERDKLGGGDMRVDKLGDKLGGDMRVDKLGGGDVHVDERGSELGLHGSWHEWCCEAGEHKSVLETIFTTLHCGPTWDGHSPHLHLTPTMHGVGVAVVNALSERLIIETTRFGIRWKQEFARGKRDCALQRVGPTIVEGTTIRFRPDPLIFKCVEPDVAAVRARIEELAWLNPQLRVWFQERRMTMRGGILGWAQRIAAKRGPLVHQVWLTQNIDDVRVDVALVWTGSGAPIVKSFVNMQPTSEGGTHVDALWDGFADYARAMGSPAARVEHVREAIGCGLVAIVHVGMYEPQFGSPSRELLESPRAAEAVHAAVLASLKPGEWYSWRIRQFVDKRLHVASGDED